ncbi:MAG: hypothetical protein HKN41_05160 [Ilumatobacter sp.]|nr:hypothetical protein [Ilumatobacter sp.]
MTIHQPPVTRDGDRITVFEPPDEPYRLAAFDLYRDIHKGIRAELFAITSTAGSLDPTVRVDREAIADHVAAVGETLRRHAHHEDQFVDPVLVEHAPVLAEKVTSDHDQLERRFDGLELLAREAVDSAAVDHRRMIHLLYLELATFTSAYLTHQNIEERVIMPTLERAIGPAAVQAIDEAIVASIPPDEIARTLSFMLPAMNTVDRVEMLTGMRQSAPPEAFAAVVDLARSVLSTADVVALESRMVLS